MKKRIIMIRDARWRISNEGVYFKRNEFYELPEDIADELIQKRFANEAPIEENEKKAVIGQYDNKMMDTSKKEVKETETKKDDKIEKEKTVQDVCEDKKESKQASVEDEPKKKKRGRPKKEQ